MIGIFGGSGLYRLFDDFEERSVDTSYGSASAPRLIGAIDGMPAAFMPRHGDRHEPPPQRRWASRPPPAPTGGRLARCSRLAGRPDRP